MIEGERMRQFQITADDLAKLETAVPELADALMTHLTPRLKVQITACKTILSNVRWKYGPPIAVEVIED